MPVVVLLYHRIVDDAMAAADPMRLSVGRLRFAEQMRWLGKHCRVLPLAAALAPAHARNPALTVAITFDDAYGESVRHGAAILVAERLPATVFVSPAHVDEQQPFWWDALWRACRKGRNHQAAVAELTARSEALMHLGDEAARAAVEALAPGCFADASECELPATWPDLRALPAELISFGVHGERHDCLAALSPAAMRASLRRAVERLRAAGLEPLDALAYPYGFAGSVTPDQLREVVPHWFQWGLSTCRGALGRGGADPRWLPRCYVEHWDAATLADHLDEWTRES
jgi:peptidoglycan/xylan/chitin deacetylase (PgdA/CDA1 family)